MIDEDLRKSKEAQDREGALWAAMIEEDLAMKGLSGTERLAAQIEHWQKKNLEEKQDREGAIWAAMIEEDQEKQAEQLLQEQRRLKRKQVAETVARSVNAKYA